jgi:hypothetical protein
MSEDKKWLSDCCNAPCLGEVYLANSWQAIGFCCDCRDKTTFHVEGQEPDEDRAYDITT